MSNGRVAHTNCDMTAVGFEPTQLALVELESTPSDHSGKLSCSIQFSFHLGLRFLLVGCELGLGSSQWTRPADFQPNA